MIWTKQCIFLKFDHPTYENYTSPFGKGGSREIFQVDNLLNPPWPPFFKGGNPFDFYCIRTIGEIMKCEFCDGETKINKVKRQHWLKRKLYILEDVSAEVCKECGERYFHAKTLDAIDRYLSKEHTVKANLNVDVVSVSQAMA